MKKYELLIRRQILVGEPSAQTAPEKGQGGDNTLYTYESINNYMENPCEQQVPNKGQHTLLRPIPQIPPPPCGPPPAVPSSQAYMDHSLAAHLISMNNPMVAAAATMNARANLLTAQQQQLQYMSALAAVTPNLGMAGSQSNLLQSPNNNNNNR
ncbi:hypothetical protein Ciccas_008939 [Cichlidogyrus casuarinus]|uniref:Uncharacterized protein n=1 Tax=Cichlidogyrus casuarinus TaxID=1844966 RepID=A0ABD2PYH0_9PLAT